MMTNNKLPNHYDDTIKTQENQNDDSMKIKKILSFLVAMVDDIGTMKHTRTKRKQNETI